MSLCCPFWTFSKSMSYKATIDWQSEMEQCNSGKLKTYVETLHVACCHCMEATKILNSCGSQSWSLYSNHGLASSEPPQWSPSALSKILQTACLRRSHTDQPVKSCRCIYWGKEAETQCKLSMSINYFDGRGTRGWNLHSQVVGQLLY